MTNVNSTGNRVIATGSAPFSNPPLNKLLNQVTSMKLDRSNFLLSNNLALPIFQSYNGEGHLLGSTPWPPKYIQTTSNVAVDSTGASSFEAVVGETTSSTMEAVVNPQYEAWITVDQLLPRWMYNSMILEVATQVMVCENTKDLWATVEGLFDMQSRVEEDYLRHVFQQSRKNGLKIVDYIRVMKSHADNLSQAENLVSTRNLVRK